MGYREFLEQQTADWEKISEELRAKEEHADRIHDYNMRSFHIFSVIGVAIIAAAITLWFVTDNYLWAYASLLAAPVFMLGTSIFRRNYD